MKVKIFSFNYHKNDVEKLSQKVLWVSDKDFITFIVQNKVPLDCFTSWNNVVLSSFNILTM